MLALVGSQSSPMRGRYLIRNWKWNAAFYTMDFVLSILNWTIRHGSTRIREAPERILLANAAHLGDILLSTSVLPVIRAAFPGIEIGFLAGTWAKPILEKHPFIGHVHYADHYLASREPVGRTARIRTYLRSKRVAIAEIRDVGYDVSIDLYSFFPNFIPLLWEARVPVRVGYNSGGFGPLLSHPLRLRNSDRHETDIQADLLRTLQIPSYAFLEQRMTLPSLPTAAEFTQACRALSAAALDASSYRVIHMGSGGSSQREWPVEAWRSLCERLVQQGHRLLFTGLGQHERDLADSVAATLERSTNAVGCLAWREFLAVLRHAELVYSVETSAGHLAAALDTPCVSIYSGMHGPNRWRPKGKHCRLLMAPVHCAPCFRRQGCEGMECVRNVQPDEVFSAGEELLREARAS